jgi:hypothetical protein
VPIGDIHSVTNTLGRAVEYSTGHHQNEFAYWLIVLKRCKLHTSTS